MIIAMAIQIKARVEEFTSIAIHPSATVKYAAVQWRKPNP